MALTLAIGQQLIVLQLAKAHMILPNKSYKQIKRLGERSDYPNLIYEVMEDLDKGKATCFANPSIGTVITKPIYHDGKLGMIVWVAIGYCANAIKRYLPFFEKVAKGSGCKFIEFRTRRKGFKRLAPQFNFKESRPIGGFFIFTKEV
jgi:hypothetical protein